MQVLHGAKTCFTTIKNQLICYARKKLTAQNNSFRRPWPRVSVRLRWPSLHTVRLRTRRKQTLPRGCKKTRSFLQSKATEKNKAHLRNFFTKVIMPLRNCSLTS
jgi:hypothetical protein